MKGLKLLCGLTKELKVSIISDPLNFTAPTSIILSLFGERPVVSRSREIHSPGNIDSFLSLLDIYR